MWQKIWSWGAVGAVALFLWGGGFTLMTSARFVAADVCYLAGAFLLALKFITWEEHKHKSQSKKIQDTAVCLFVVGCVTLGLVGYNHYVNKIFPWSSADKLASMNQPPAPPPVKEEPQTGNSGETGKAAVRNPQKNAVKHLEPKEMPKSLASPTSTPVPSPEVIPTPEPTPIQRVDWHIKQNWRKFLRIDMTKEDVRQLFGDPESVSVVSDSEFWDYGSGSIHFDRGTLWSWSEPRY
jgi:hypothetical protein